MKRSIIETFDQACEAYRSHCSANGIEYQDPFMAFTQLNRLSVRLFNRENELLARYDRKQQTIVNSFGKNRNKIGINEINAGKPGTI
jgi:hypothetical protein